MKAYKHGRTYFTAFSQVLNSAILIKVLEISRQLVNFNLLMDYWNINRRQTLNSLACGFGGLAFGALAHKDAIASSNSPKEIFHHRPKAKRIIFIFIQV